MARKLFCLLGAMAWATLAVLNFRDGDMWYGVAAAFIAGASLGAVFPLVAVVVLFPLAVAVRFILWPVRAVARGRRRRDLAGRSIPVADHRGPIVTRYDIDGRPRTDWSDNT